MFYMYLSFFQPNQQLPSANSWMYNNQSLREFLGGQAANKADNSTDTQLHSHGQKMRETFQDNDFCCFLQFRLILSGKNCIFCTAGFALSGVQGACQSGLPAEKIESLTVDTAFRVCLLLVSQSSAGSVFFSFLFLDLFFSINLGRVPKTLGSHIYHPYSGLWSFLFLIASWCATGSFREPFLIFSFQEKLIFPLHAILQVSFFYCFLTQRAVWRHTKCKAVAGNLRIVCQGSLCFPPGLTHPARSTCALTTDGKDRWLFVRGFVHLRWGRTRHQVSEKCSRAVHTTDVIMIYHNALPVHRQQQ